MTYSRGTTISPIKLSEEYTEMYRLVANEGKVSTNGEIIAPCVDTENVDGWYEIDVEISTDALEQ